METLYLDFETTGLASATATDIEKQPHIIEIAASIGGNKFHTFVKPPGPIDPEVTRITKITDEDVADAPTFAHVWKPFAEFCLGAKVWVAHNMEFDKAILVNELTRIDKLTAFPWPMYFECTYKLALQLPASKRPEKTNLGALYQHITSEKLGGAHRADVDVAALIVVHDWLENQYA